MQSHLDIIINAIYPQNKRKKKYITYWFTSAETAEIISQIYIKIQLSNIDVGEVDDQLLLMDLFRDIIMKPI